nr:MinD/ParA family protein [Mycobacterium sp. E2989]
MPIDLPRQPVATTPEAPPVERPKQPPPESDRLQQPPPAEPKPPAPQPEPEPRTHAPAQHARHARRANRGDADGQDLPNTGPSRHSHRAKPTTPSAAPSPRVSPSAAKPNGGPVPPASKQRERDLAPARPAAQRPAESPAHRGSPPAPANGDRGPGSAVTHTGPKPADTAEADAVPQRGWRRWVYASTRINVGLSRDEKYELDLHRRIRRLPRGAHEIAIVGLKGGVGKTAVTVALGSVLAQVRGDRILAFDADADSGNLADRVGRRPASSVADLLARKDLSHYNDVRAHTGVNAVNLEVLAAQEYSSAPRPFSAADWRYAADAVSRFYNVVLADCGAGLTRGVLATASGVVIVTTPSIDGSRQATVAIDWLRNSGRQELLSRACVVINHVAPGEPNVAITGLVRQFSQDVRPERIVVLPWDKHVGAGKEIEIGQLDPVYKRRITELAAALSDDFDRGERR